VTEPLSGKIPPRSNFIAWLRERRDQVIGHTGSWDNCPFRCWLGFPVRAIDLGFNHWLVQDMTKIDSISLAGTPVTGKDVLKRLEV